ncbi:hypothetical protein [Deinococcus ruber]|uniref:Uncharacterized protein n=1 Tax=Deinococcus ruber TaxID=1848197 RepID=A0A918CAC9_9DEIO|nr:hypothetical protein [Deinococcus ruber]GGR11570.1 hypothetical protein GCM10008957_25670 [Deinococcus ruber]
MPGEVPVLEAVLTQLFAAAAVSGQPAAYIVARGLHLKAIVRPSGKKEVLLWRTQDRFPSGKECDIVARDGGFVEPKFKPWLCEGIDGFHLRDLADWQNSCTHTWGSVLFLDGKSESGTSRTCTRCNTTAGTMHKRRGKSTVFLYNEHEVSEATYVLATVTGPMPSSLDVAEKQRLRQEALDELRPSLGIPLPTLTGQVCATCRHGTPDRELIACNLGWPFHDPPQPNAYNPRTKKADIEVLLGHPGVPLPLLAPHTHCMAYKNSWLPRLAI